MCGGSESGEPSATASGAEGPPEYVKLSRVGRIGYDSVGARGCAAIGSP